MRGISADGRPVDSTEIEPAEAGGMLAALDVPTLRAFLIRIALAGGASRKQIMKAMRASESTYHRDIRVPIPGLTPNP